MSPTVRVAVAQVDVHDGDVARNVGTATSTMRRAADLGVELLVFPECSLTGYLFPDRASCFEASILADGPEVQDLVTACRDLDTSIVVGLLERTSLGVHNTAIAVGPTGVIGRYRKAHLPPMGADLYTLPGDDRPVVVEMAGLRVGLCICYDMRFPEWSRCLSLDGADLIATPTNWITGAEVVAEHFLPTRACENVLFVAVANRGDMSGDVSFIGRSQIVAPSGHVVALAQRQEDLVVADIDRQQAREDLVPTSGTYSLRVMADRRPELYQGLTEQRSSKSRW
jgi:predicted amidohydrolase